MDASGFSFGSRRESSEASARTELWKTNCLHSRTSRVVVRHLAVASPPRNHAGLVPQEGWKSGHQKSHRGVSWVAPYSARTCDLMSMELRDNRGPAACCSPCTRGCRRGFRPGRLQRRWRGRWTHRAGERSGRPGSTTTWRRGWRRTTVGSRYRVVCYVSSERTLFELIVMSWLYPFYVVISGFEKCLYR